MKETDDSFMHTSSGPFSACQDDHQQRHGISTSILSPRSLPPPPPPPPPSQWPPCRTPALSTSPVFTVFYSSGPTKLLRLTSSRSTASTSPTAISTWSRLWRTPSAPSTLRWHAPKLHGASLPQPRGRRITTRNVVCIPRPRAPRLPVPRSHASSSKTYHPPVPTSPSLLLLLLTLTPQ